VNSAPHSMHNCHQPVPISPRRSRRPEHPTWFFHCAVLRHRRAQSHRPNYMPLAGPKQFKPAPLFLAGMLLRHVGQTPVVIARITAAVCGLLFGFMDVLFTPLVRTLAGSETLVVRCPSPFLVIPLSWRVTFLLSAFLGGFSPSPTLDQVRRFTWAGIFYGSKDNV